MSPVRRALSVVNSLVSFFWHGLSVEVVVSAACVGGCSVELHVSISYLLFHMVRNPGRTRFARRQASSSIMGTVEINQVSVYATRRYARAAMGRLCHPAAQRGIWEDG